MKENSGHNTGLPLLLGTAKVDITPERPLHLGGYGHRTSVFEGVNHRLYARVALFRQNEGTGTRQLLLITGDLLGWGNDFTAILRDKLHARWGFRADDIMLSASHTHSGPQIDKRLSMIGALEEDYIQSLEQKVLAAVEQALQNMEPVTVSRGSGECHFGIYRRQMVDGNIVMLPNKEGPNDQEVTVVQFTTSAGIAKSLIVHFTCHTTTTGDNFVSSEYSGVAMELVEQELGNDSVSMFVQGCCGDIRPALVRDGRFYSGHDEEVRDLGGQLHKEVVKILSRPMQPLQPVLLQSERIESPLVYAHVPTLDELEESKQSDNKWVQRWAGLLLAHPEWLVPSIPLDLVRFDIAEGLSLLSMNAEMVVKYGLYVKQRSDRCVLPLGYTNGVLGYVPTAEQIAEGGYEAGDSHFYFGLCSPFVPAIEQAIQDSLDKLLDSVNSLQLYLK